MPTETLVERLESLADERLTLVHCPKCDPEDYNHPAGVCCDECPRQLAKDALTALAAQAWQPMEMAPKGPHVLALYEEFGVTYWGCARWETFNDGSGGWIGSSFYATQDRNWTTFSSAENFRGWMPLPPAPRTGMSQRTETRSTEDLEKQMCGSDSPNQDHMPFRCNQIFRHRGDHMWTDQNGKVWDRWPRVKR